MEYYTAIKKDKFMSFTGTWMNLETIIFSKTDTRIENQTLNALTPKWLLNNEKTRTQKGNISHLGLLVGGGLGE